MSLLARFRWRARAARRTAGRRLLEAFARECPGAYFVEIGAADGVTDDHLHPLIAAHQWRGLMVEPVPYVFERLADNYAGVDRVALENVAITDHDGSVPFFHFAEPTPGEAAQLPRQYPLLGSLSRSMLEQHDYVPDHERRIVSTTVPCRSLASLLREHRVERIDVFVVDAEGADCAIIGQLDFDAFRPRILVYEDANVPEAENSACVSMLTRLGYETLVEGFDTWCFDATIGDRLTTVWRELKRAGPAVSRADLDRWFSDAARGEDHAH